jgi:two-component system, cell cycle response regulator
MTDAPRRPSGAPKTLKAGDYPSLGVEVLKRVKASHRPVLVVLSGNEVGQRVVVDQTLIIGRDPAAAVTLTDGLVSWHHARIEDRGDSWALVDLDSTNGTMINGERVTEATLRPDDKIVFGNAVLSFELQDELQQQYNEVVERLLNIDDLSGLLVRRRFDAELLLLLESARQQGQPLALLVMDLDGVKSINDAHGHLFGAYVIGESGRVIGQVLGTRGVACRFGGDEYIAALPETDTAAGVAIGQEILEAVTSHHYERENIQLKPGISIGVASFPEDATDAGGLFQRADEAMYRAKQAGKNRVSR